ncbi:variable large family protein [Borrelia puertoricensis]
MFAANADIADNPDYTDAVKGAAVSAINKVLGTLTIDSQTPEAKNK